MKRCLLLPVLVLAACSSEKSMIVLSFGATSPGFESVREGTNDGFAVGGPGPDNPFGSVTIYADGRNIDTLEFGGSMRTLASGGTPPKKIRFEGETVMETFYGISRLDAEYNGILLKKGKLEPGDINLQLSWNEEKQTYSVKATE